MQLIVKVEEPTKVNLGSLSLELIAPIEEYRKDRKMPRCQLNNSHVRLIIINFLHAIQYI